MPITHSAAKRFRQNTKRARKNSLLRSKLDQLRKSVNKVSKQQNQSELSASLKTLSSLVDKMERKGTIKRNTAARIKSRVAKATKRPAT